MLSPRTDVAIVGAGPAGAWAGYHLARGGARVTIFDGTHPREKPCGGGVTARAWRLVASALQQRAVPAVVIEWARFEADGATAVRVPLAARGVSPDSTLLVASRRALDGALLEAALDAGATLAPERVIDVVAGGGRAVLRTPSGSYHAGWLIGADGANSLVRRRVLAPFARSQLSIATGYFAHGVSSREMIVRFIAIPAGYLWSFPRPDHLAIGICAQADDARAAALRAYAAAWIAQSGIADGARLEPYSWSIPSLSPSDFDREHPTGPGWMLVGDAAGLVDPITREGIYFALRSAELAADALLHASGSEPVAYLDRLREEIYPELRRAARVKASFFHGSFARLVLKALAGSAAIRDVMADLIAGSQPYASLKRRLLASLHIGLAWRFLMMEVSGDLRRPAAASITAASRPDAATRTHPGRRRS